MPRELALLLIFAGGLATFATSLLLFLDSLRGGEVARPENAVEDDASAAGAADSGLVEAAAPRRRATAFIFIGFLPVPLVFGAFWRSGPRNRLLGTIYLAGLALVILGAALWFAAR